MARKTTGFHTRLKGVSIQFLWRLSIYYTATWTSWDMTLNLFFMRLAIRNLPYKPQTCSIPSRPMPIPYPINPKPYKSSLCLACSFRVQHQTKAPIWSASTGQSGLQRCPGSKSSSGSGFLVEMFSIVPKP